MKIPYKVPYHWARGTVNHAQAILTAVHTDEGIIGYGESIGTPSVDAIQAHLSLAAEQNHFGTCNSPRYAGQVFAGLEMRCGPGKGEVPTR